MTNSKDNKTKAPNVPPLRFPEFTDEWVEITIQNLATVLGGGTPDTTNKSYWDGNIQWFTPSEIGKNKYVNTSLRTITEDGLNNSSAKLLPPHTILLSSRATVGECSLTLQECATNQGFQSLIAKNCDTDFLYYLIQTKKKELIKKSCGSTFLEISANEVRKIKVAIPTKEEQLKISLLLSLLDERIATQNKIIEDLKKLKSAIIDKLYSEVIGKEYSYSELFSIVTERNTNRTYSKVIAASQEYGMIERDSLNLKVQFDDSSLHTYKIIHPGDYVIHLRSFQGGYAFSRLKGICRPAYVILRPHESVEYGYFEHYFNSTKFVNSLRLVTYGIRDGRSINVDEWMSMKVVLPSNEEQDKIIRTIQSIDSKLENEKKIFTLLSQQRQFLLRQLFI